jgi:hypothetical protein
MDLVEQCLAAEFKFESVLQARFAVLKGMGAEATSVQVLTYSHTEYISADSLAQHLLMHYIPLYKSTSLALQYCEVHGTFFSPVSMLIIVHFCRL